LAESRQKLRTLASHQEQLLELERKHIAREVHDELGQLLTALKMDVSLIRLRFSDNAALMEKTEDMRVLVERTIGVVRQVASNLRPAALDFGLVPALEWLCEDFSQRGATNCRLENGGLEIALIDTQSTAVFRVVQESLTNVARHAQASEVVISLQADHCLLKVVVADNGQGFDISAIGKSSGFGLFGMRERMLALDGTLSIVSTPDLGTTVTIELPLSKGEAP
jgi:signal transduction histidine kinase